jgi:hypothetical protein
MKRILLLGVVCVLGGVSLAPLRAAPVDCGPATFQDLVDLTADGCISEDKIFSNFVNGDGAGNNLVPADTPATIGLIAIPGFDFHQLVLGSFNPGTYQFSYDVRVDETNPANDPIFINLATAGVDVGFTPVSINKQLTDLATGNLYSLATTGANDSVTLAPPAKAVHTAVTITVGSDGFANSVSDQYVQIRQIEPGEIPEPTTYSLLGLGLLGLGVLGRRRTPRNPNA